jgi:hypothetical protein
VGFNEGLPKSADVYLLRKIDALHDLEWERFMRLFDMVWELHERVRRLEREEG